MRATEYGYETQEQWLGAASLPSEASANIPKFKPVSTGIGYLTDFQRKTPVEIKVSAGIEFLHLHIEGKLTRPDFPFEVFNTVAENHTKLASFQNLFLYSRFQRKGAVQDRQYCSSVSLLSYSDSGVTKVNVGYYGGGITGQIPEVGWEIVRLMAKIGFPVTIENESLKSITGGQAEIYNASLFCEIDGITTERIQQMAGLVTALASEIFNYSWDVGTVDEEIAKPRGFEMIRTVREVGLTADEYKITVRYRITSKLGWDVIRDCCGEGERLHHFIGNYSEKRQKITLCVATTASGHRLCLFSRQPISEAQLAQADAALGVHFDREPFVWPGKREKTE